MKSNTIRFFLVLMTIFSLTACVVPKEKAYGYVVSSGCNLGEYDALTDMADNKVDRRYFPKEEIKFNFLDGYAISDNQKEEFKKLFKTSAQGCYVHTVYSNQSPGKFRI